VSEIAPFLAILMGKGAKKQRGGRGAKQHKGGEMLNN